MSNDTATNTGNMFMFHCPAVGRDARYIVCQFKRDKHWRGENFRDQDCRCAMRGGKCIAVDMLKMEWREKEPIFFTKIDKGVQSLPAELVDHTNRVLLFRSHTAGLDLTPEQTTRLLGDRASMPALTDGPLMVPVPAGTKIRKERKETKKEPSMSDALGQAMVDMSSLINKALET